MRNGDRAAETIEYKGYTIEIHQDVDPESPFEWDQLGKWVCWHRQYTLSSSKEFSRYSPEEFAQWAEDNKHLIFPLYMYDHSGIAFSLGNGCYPFNDLWDAGQVGYILVERERAIAEFGKKLLTKQVRKKVERRVEQEVETMNQYYAGDVWGYVIKGEDGSDLEEIDDSCWGFYGFDYCVKEAKSQVDYFAERDHKARLAKLRQYIVNRVPLTKRTFAQ